MMNEAQWNMANCMEQKLPFMRGLINHIIDHSDAWKKYVDNDNEDPAKLFDNLPKDFADDLSIFPKLLLIRLF
jgi:hypothetical protein